MQNPRKQTAGINAGNHPLVMETKALKGNGDRQNNLDAGTTTSFGYN